MQQDRKKKHWYLLAFSVQHPGVWIPTSFAYAVDNMFISLPELHKAKELHKIPNNSVIISVSYLGYGNDREFNGLPDIDPPSHISDAFSAGLLAGITIPENAPSQPVNPYTDNKDNDPYIEHTSREWSTGFLLGRSTAKNVAMKPVTTPDPAKQQEAKK